MRGMNQNLCSLRKLEDTFPLGVGHIKPRLSHHHTSITVLLTIPLRYYSWLASVCSFCIRMKCLCCRFFQLTLVRRLGRVVLCDCDLSLPSAYDNVFWRYSEPSLQRQHLLSKTLPLKWICGCAEYLMSGLICKCKEGLVLFLSSHRTYVLIFVRSLHSLRRL